jgi:hypothetical protein
MKRISATMSAFTLLSCLYCSGCVTAPQVSYQRDVYPILAEKCIACHKPPYGDGYRQTKLDMSSYEGLMEGSIYGPVIVPGNSKRSPLNMLAEGRAGDLLRTMKERHQTISDREITIFRMWVDQGALNN